MPLNKVLLVTALASATLTLRCQDGNTSSRNITEVKHLELKQFSDG